MKILVAIYKLTKNPEQHYDDIERLLSLNNDTHQQNSNIRHWSKIKLNILARNLYTRIVNYVIKCVNRFGGSRRNSGDSALSLYIFNTFPLTAQSSQAKSLQDLLVNLHRETLRVISVINIPVDQKKSICVCTM